MLQKEFGTNALGHLTFEGKDTVELAGKYSTPAYIMSERKIRENCKKYTEAFKKYFSPASSPAYASKAFCCMGIYKIINDEGMCADVVSPGEIYTAFKAGFPMEKLFFHGNNKTDPDISLALELGVGYFVSDNLEEIDALDRIASEKGKKQKILLRVSPGIDPHTLEAITTGKVDSKFGIPIETGQAEEAVKYILTKKNIFLCGIHCHIGSQCFDSKSFLDASGIMLGFIKKIIDSTSYTLKMLNLGGGYGVRYTDSDGKIDIPENISLVSKHINEVCEKLGIDIPDIIMEPGRSIVADAGITLYTCGTVKTITGYKSYISVDGGMTDNPRYALYKSPYTVINASKASDEPDFTATIAGRCCESGDLIQENVKIKRPVRGDIIVTPVTGAYHYSMSSNYNRIAKPPVILIREDGIESVMIKRETLDDLISKDTDCPAK